MVLLEIDGLRCTYPGADQPALEDISLGLEAGEILAVAGASGSGKSTLCRTICGFFTSFYKGRVEGRLLACGLDAAGDSCRELVAGATMLFQNPFNQFSGMRFSVAEELALGPENLGFSREETAEAVAKAMEAAEVADLAAKNPFALSGGQAQAVALAAALAMRPEMLVLDEPASQLDPAARRRLHSLIRRLAGEGMAVLFTCREAGDMALADQALVLAHGRAMSFGPADRAARSEELSSLGVIPSPYARLAAEARKRGLWPKDKKLPLSLDEALEGFGEDRP